MAWIKSYQALEKHPKLLKFMKTLNVNQNEAIGIIHKFWWWCLDYAETGNLLDVDPEILGNTLGVPNLLEALKTSGFVDIKPLRVHDWFDYTYEFLKLKYHTSNPEKYNKIVRYRHKIQAIPKVIPKAIPKVRQDEEEKIEKTRKDTCAFDKVWGTYPKRLGKKEALRHFNASVLSAEDYANIQTAVANYCQYLSDQKVDEQYIKHGSTFFNNWKDWISYKGVSGVFPKKQLSQQEKDRIDAERGVK